VAFNQDQAHVGAAPEIQAGAPRECLSRRRGHLGVIALAALRAISRYPGLRGPGRLSARRKPPA